MQRLTSMALADAAGGLALMPLHPELSCTAPMQQCKHRLLPSSGVFLPVGCRVKAAESPVIGSSGIVPDTAGPMRRSKDAFLTFQKDADQIYPGWKETLGYTGESFVQVACLAFFDWGKGAVILCGWLFIGADICFALVQHLVVQCCAALYQFHSTLYALSDFCFPLIGSTHRQERDQEE